VLPSVDAYVRQLPNGVESYPAAFVKGSVVRALVERSGYLAALPPGSLPASIEKALRDGIGVTAWLPETFHGTLAAATYDVDFCDKGGMPAYEASVLAGNRALLNSALYRVMFLVASPERILIGAERRWASFHRGSELRVLDHTPKTATVRLVHPPRLFGEHAARGIAMALRAAIDAAGAKCVDVSTTTESETSVLYAGTWAR